MPASIKHTDVSLGLGPSRMVGPDFKIIGKKIGAGNFGEVRLGLNIKTNEKVAVKIERIVSIQGHKGCGPSAIRLRQEFEMLRLIYRGYPKGHKINGIPKIYHFARCGTLDCMVLELLGPNLEDLFEMCHSRFSIKTVCMIAFQLLDRIETVHSRGLVYRDVKPENFLLGRKNSKESNIIHLVDFGLATYYRDPLTGKHLPYLDLKTMTGTARYMSVHSHLGKAQSRRDDLESIGYVLIYFLKGRLPWQGFKTGGNVKEKYRKIRDSKMKVPVTILCQGLPKEFETYMNYVKALKFSDAPDYEYLKDLIHKLYENQGFSYESTVFDWSKDGRELPTDVNRYNRARRGSKVSSVNTEASDEHDDEEDVESKYQEEFNDTLAELNNIKKQTKAMGRLNTSQMNVRSLSLSDTGAALCCSSTDVSETVNMSTVPITVQPSSPSIVDLYNSKVRYYKNEEERRSPSQGYHSNELKNEFKEQDPEEIQVLPEGVAMCQGCTKAKYSEQKVSFLCFTWRKKKKGLTYHTCQCKQS